MKLETGRAIAITSFAVIASSLCLVSGAFGQIIPKPQLENAYSNFMRGRFGNVIQILTPYDRQPPRRLSMDFMMGVSKCRTGRTVDGHARLARLAADYEITKSKSEDIAAQLNDCGKGNLPIAGLEGKADRFSSPPVAKVSPTQAASSASPQMSGLEYGWSYNQGDIYSRAARSAKYCSNICLGDGRCRAMTYITSQKVCWIKDRVPANKGMSSDMTSAIKLFD